MKKTYVFLAAIGLTCLGTNASFAQQQEYTPQQLEALKQAATQGDVASQENLGQIYQFGKFGVKKNLFTARDWYEKAAAKGGVVAMINLGNMYQKGDAIPQDYTKAQALFEQAASKDNPIAEYNLGVMYQDGKGIKKDYPKAMEYYQKAAAQGYGNAYNNIGVLYQYGLGVHQTKSAALDNFKQACENDSHQGCENYKKFDKKDTKD